MKSQWDGQQMGHSPTQCLLLPPAFTVFISCLKGYDLIFFLPLPPPHLLLLSLTPHPSFSYLLSLPLFTQLHLLHSLILIFPSALLVTIYPCPSSFKLSSSSASTPHPAPLPPSLTCCSPNPSSFIIPLFPAPSVSFYFPGQLTWCTVLWGFPAGVAIVVSDRCVCVCVSV